MTKATPGKTITDFVAELEDQNRTVADWAREHGYTLSIVYGLLRGLTLGRRGQAREVLIAMGVTPPPLHAYGKQVEPRTNVRPRVARAEA